METQVATATGQEPVQKQTQYFDRYFKPAADINEQNGKYHIYLDVPGVTREQIKINLSEDLIEIDAIMKSPKDCVLLGRPCRDHWTRRFELEKVIDKEKVEAKLEAGVLEVILPLGKKQLPKEVLVH